MMQKLRRLFLGLSGAREEILEQCPSERVKFESLGAAILITSGLAAVSMWFALSSAMGVNGIVAVLPAVAWGVVIMCIDRWLITSMPIEGKRKFAIAAPRVFLAILLGTLISTPFVLRIFQSEINAQISVIKQDRYSAFLAQQQNSKVNQQVTYWRNQVSDLQKVIDSNGAAALSSSADSQVQLLNGQLDKWLKLEQQYYQQWQCQLYGGSGCPKGNGPLSQTSHANYLHAQSEVASIQNQLQQRDNELASNSATEEKARYDQAVSALPAAQRQLQVAVARQNALQASFYAQNQATNGILIRLQALSQLSNGDFTVASARFLLFLLFLAIECLPVTVKLLQQPGPYEKILLAARESELRAGRRFYRGQSRLGMNGLDDLGGQPVMEPHAEQPRQDVDVRAIFNQTKLLAQPIGHPLDEQETERVGHQPPPRRHADDQLWEERPREDAPREDWQRDAYTAEPRREEPYLAETRRDYPPYLDETRMDDPLGSEHQRDEAYREDSLPAEPRHDRNVVDTGELPVFHRDLRDMDDDRVSASSDGHGGGIPLHWDDE
jgi:Domain of unknown function (DUF4407)